MNNKNDDEYSDKLSYKIAHLIGSVVVKLIPFIRKVNIRLALRISVLSLLLLMVYVEFLQNQDRNNELLYDALIPGKSTSENFYAFERAGGLDNEPYWNGYLVNDVKPWYKPKSRTDHFTIELSRDPGNSKGISYETLKSDLEYLCGTKWYGNNQNITNIGKYELKHENSCVVEKVYSPDYEYWVAVMHRASK